MIKSYFLIAWRSLVKNKIYSTINILGLSLGIAVCMLITLFVKDEYSFDQFQEKKENIYRLVARETSPKNEDFNIGDTGFRHGRSFFGQVPELEKMVRMESQMLSVRANNDIYLQSGLEVDTAFFDVFSAEFVEGNADRPLSTKNSMVISQSVAQKYFGQEKALGKSIEIERGGNFETYIVNGVTKDMPQNSSINIQMLLPFDYAKRTDDAWINFYLNTFFLVKPGSDIQKIEQQFAAIFDREAKEQLAQAKKDWNYENMLHFKLQPILDLHLSKTFRAQNGLRESSSSKLSFVLMGLALFILLIACINFVNISMSHSIQRAKEIGVRKVVGGQRSQLIWQFMCESFIMNAAAFFLAVIWVQLALPVFNDMSSKALAFSYLFDVKLIATFAVIFLATGFLAGFYPSLVLSKFQPVETLYGRFKWSGKQVLQKSLIVFQFGLASFFIILTFVQTRQVDYFLNRDLGYDDRNILVVEARNTNESKGRTLIQTLKNNPNILNVAPANAGMWYTAVMDLNGTQYGPNMNVIDENFVETMGLTISQGRNFSAEFPSDSAQSILVNEAFVKEAGWENPIGQVLKIYNQFPMTIVGVLKDYNFGSLYENIRPQIFTSHPRFGGYSAFYIKTSGSDMPKTIDYVKQSFKDIYPTEPFGYDYKSEINKEQYSKEFQMRQIALWTAGIMIFISCMGLLGLSILTTERRKKEIGVRKVLGASLAAIVQKLSWDFLRLVVIAFVIFAPLAYFTSERLLRNYPYRVDIKADMFVISFMALATLSFVTISYQALKAALANPVKSLKSE